MTGTLRTIGATIAFGAGVFAWQARDVAEGGLVVALTLAAVAVAALGARRPTTGEQRREAMNEGTP